MLQRMLLAQPSLLTYHPATLSLNLHAMAECMGASLPKVCKSLLLPSDWPGVQSLVSACAHLAELIFYCPWSLCIDVADLRH